MNNKLTDEEKRVIINKGTEAPFTGIYTHHHEMGTYVCKQCSTPLFKSSSKFDSGCGWPSFDDAIEGAVRQVPDADGRRTEIICAHCGGHLGHVFANEGFTPKETRHCVNSVSLLFIPQKKKDVIEKEIAIFAGGCFWGMEYHFQKVKGVVSVTSGYTGGKTQNPTYEEVCSGLTGHAEAVKIEFDPELVNYETLAMLFFEIHDPEQIDRQGPDIGIQYRSEVFYTNPNQLLVAEKLIQELKEKGYWIATQLTKATEFYPAEAYHQDYYHRNGAEPYCHIYTQRF